NQLRESFHPEPSSRARREIISMTQTYSRPCSSSRLPALRASQNRNREVQNSPSFEDTAVLNFATKRRKKHHWLLVLSAFCGYAQGPADQLRSKAHKELIVTKER